MAGLAAIADAVEAAIAQAATGLREDVRAALVGALAAESSERGRAVIAQLLENDEIARRDGVPVCQDTGTAWVRLELGADQALGGDPQVAVDAAVRAAYRDGSLRMSVASDALCDRANTGDNTPAWLDVHLRPGSGARVDVMLKGGGSDNASAVFMLPPSAGEDGIVEAVVERVLAKGASACPPLVIGVGIGGTFDSVAKLSKEALLVPLGEPSLECAARVERCVLEAVNASGIGPAGLGGDTTALAVRVLTAPCHIAALPVAVNVGCCALRTASVEIA